MDDVITLVSESVTSHDDYGNEIITTESRQVFCKTYGVDRNEYYSASTVGLKPENSKAYRRNKTRNWKCEYHETSSGTFICIVAITAL